MTVITQPPVVEIYATFCADLDGDSLNRLFFNFAGATQKGIGAVHLLFQSTGGSVSDGVSLFNYFKGLPVELHIYNTGGVASAAFTAFVGAKHRYASAHAAFLLHRARHSLLTPGQAIDHRTRADVLALEDSRCETIIRDATQIPEEKWTIYAAGAEVPITAQEALQYGIKRDTRVPASCGPPALRLLIAT